MARCAPLPNLSNFVESFHLSFNPENTNAFDLQRSVLSLSRDSCHSSGTCRVNSEEMRGKVSSAFGQPGPFPKSERP